MTKTYLEDVPLDDGSPGVFQRLLPVFEARLVFLVLAPAKLDLADGISASNQIIIADLIKYANYVSDFSTKQRLYRDIQSDSLHLHLLDDKDKGFVPVGIQVAALDAGLLFLSNPLLLLVKQLELDIRVRGASDVHLLQFPGLQNSNCEKTKNVTIFKLNQEFKSTIITCQFS